MTNKSKPKPQRKAPASKRYVYREARGGELEELTRDGWEMARDDITLSPYGRWATGSYLLRRLEPLPRLQEELTKTRAEMKQLRDQLRVRTEKMREELQRVQRISACHATFERKNKRPPKVDLESDVDTLRRKLAKIETLSKNALFIDEKVAEVKLKVTGNTNPESVR